MLGHVYGVWCMVGLHVWIDGWRVLADLHLGIATNLHVLHAGCKMWMVWACVYLDWCWIWYVIIVNWTAGMASGLVWARYRVPGHGVVCCRLHVIGVWCRICSKCSSVWTDGVLMCATRNWRELQDACLVLPIIGLLPAAEVLFLCKIVVMLEFM